MGGWILGIELDGPFTNYMVYMVTPYVWQFPCDEYKVLAPQTSGDTAPDHLNVFWAGAKTS